MHYSVDLQNSGEDDAPPCKACGRLEENHDHHSYCFFTPSKKSPSICRTCGKEEVIHDVCEYFSSESARVRGEAQYCAHCGCSEHAHEVCVSFAGQLPTCETCGRLKQDHVSCDSFHPGAESLCVNCGRPRLGHTDEAILETWPQNQVHAKKSTHRFSSFAGECPGTPARWLVDGRDTFAAMADAIRKAKREILISGWYISPELYLVRDGPPSEHTRLDMLLRERARAGVLIRVLAWNETKVHGPCLRADRTAGIQVRQQLLEAAA